MKKLTLIAALLFSIGAQAKDEWQLVGEAKNVQFHFRTGSFNFQIIDAERHATIIYRMVDKKTRDTSFARWSVSTTDCKAGAGILKTTELSTGRLKYQNEFVFEGNTIASFAAEVLCLVSESITEQSI